jgi:hypothetical protein
MTIQAQALFARVAAAKPNARKDDLRDAFLKLAMEDDGVLKSIVNDMFELLWTLRKIGEEMPPRNEDA